MMQVQFLLSDLSHSEQIESDLVFIGVADKHVHYVSRNSQEMADHHLNQPSLLEERDIVHSGLRGAIWGLVISLIINFFIFFIEPFGWSPQWYNFVFITFLCMGFSSWLGGMIGISADNYKIADFHQYLINGNALLMVNSLSFTEQEKVRELMSEKHPEAKYLATREAVDNPFTTTELVEYD